MKTARKALMLILCAALLVSATVMGTLAYLTSETGAVTNTFTVGKVAITLDEALVNLYGEPIEEDLEDDAQEEVVTVNEAPRVYGNDYKMIGNQSYTKDPTVHVDKDSEDCYLFVKVVNNLEDFEAPYAYAEGKTGKIAAQMAANGWVALSGETDVYYYGNGKGEAGEDYVVFNGFKIDGSKLENDTKIGNVIIDAYAIQAEGFNSAAEAWTANRATWIDPTPDAA